MALFTGVGVALVTLFDDDGALEAKATADLAWRAASGSRSTATRCSTRCVDRMRDSQDILGLPGTGDAWSS